MILSFRRLIITASFTLFWALPVQAVTPDELFEVLQRIESLENEVRYLRGENEQLRFDMEDIKNIQKKTFIRIDDRIDDLFRAVNVRNTSSVTPVPLLPTEAQRMTKRQGSVPLMAAKPIVRGAVVVELPKSVTIAVAGVQADQSPKVTVTKSQ